MLGIFVAFDDSGSSCERFCAGCGYELLLTDRVIAFGSARLHSRRQCRLELAQRVFRGVLNALTHEAGVTLPGGGNVISVSSEVS
jgi:hypothetical protein